MHALKGVFPGGATANSDAAATTAGAAGAAAEEVEGDGDRAGSSEVGSMRARAGAMAAKWARSRYSSRSRVSSSSSRSSSRLGESSGLPSLPLRTAGPDIVDGAGRRLRLAAVNWAGGENVNYVVSGLDVSPLRSIARTIAGMGFNAARIPFSVALARDNPVVATAAVVGHRCVFDESLSCLPLRSFIIHTHTHLLSKPCGGVLRRRRGATPQAANPALYGLCALEVMDRVVDELAAAGVVAVLDNHMTDPDWCCQRADCNGLWRNGESASSEADWIAALTAVAARYRSRPSVVAVELRNEPREVCPGTSWHVGPRACHPETFVGPDSVAASAAAVNESFGSALASSEAVADGYDVRRCAWPQWDKGPKELRYKAAMEAAGAAVLAANPDLLVVVDALYYGRDLTEATGKGEVVLPGAGDRLVYAVHDYSWLGHDPAVPAFNPAAPFNSAFPSHGFFFFFSLPFIF